jgi:type I restriction enzyme S subunit
MDAQQFLEEFGHFANAPNGILRMREVILVLAMQGRLVTQSNGDHAVDLLRKVADEKQQLIRIRAMRPSTPLPEIGRGDAPHSIPETWLWVSVQYLPPSQVLGISG